MKKYSDELFVSQTTEAVGYLCRSAQISLDGRTEIAYANFCSLRRKKRSGMEIFVNAEDRTATKAYKRMKKVS